MPETDEALEVVGEWVRKAENDLKNAVHTLKLKQGCPADTVCYHAQQCVEKYVKALLVLKGVDFPKTHNIKKVFGLLPARFRPALTDEEQGRLTDYATTTRYPGDYEPIALPEARRAVAIARRVRRQIRRTLPRKALRRIRRP